MIEIKANDDHTITLHVGKDAEQGWQCVEERLDLEAAQLVQTALFLAIVEAKGGADAARS